MNTMKAAALLANLNIQITALPIPAIKDDELLVRIKAVGICGSDIPRYMKNGAHAYPVVLGHEFSGTVEKCGTDVTGFNIGDRVAGAPLIPCHKCADCIKGDFSLCKNYTFIGSRIQGAFAEYLAIPARNCVKFADTVPFIQGAFFEPSTVALHGIFLSGYDKTADIAVLGGGTIGLFTMQWLKILGCNSVTVFDISEDRLTLAKELGADFAVNSGNLSAADLKVRYQRGFGAVFETAGATTTMRTAFEIAGNKASVCFIGTPTQDLTFTPKEWENLNRKEFRLTGSWMSYSAPFPGKEWTLTAKHFSDGSLKFSDKLVFAVFPLPDAAAAFKMFETPGAVKGKIMIAMD